MRDLLECVIVGIIVVVVVIGLLLLLISPIMRMECNAKTAQISLPHTWSFWGGCRIEVTPGTWIPLENYRWMEGR